LVLFGWVGVFGGDEARSGVEIVVKTVGRFCGASIESELAHNMTVGFVEVDDMVEADAKGIFLL
jgi:hypothetical protein